MNPNTMQKALAELERLGLVYTERTSGRFVTKDQNLIMNLKKEQASVVIKDFLDKMKKIGYDDASILEFIKETLERSKE